MVNCMEMNYLDILKESLEKKLKVLDEIIQYNRDQEELLKSSQTTLEEVDAHMEQKDTFVEQLNKLDEGFESVYEHVREELKNNKEKYRNRIAAMQQLISQITDKSVLIQTQEARNKSLTERYLSSQRKNLQANRITSKKAMEYYRNVNKNNVPYTGIMDEKK